MDPHRDDQEDAKRYINAYVVISPISEPAAFNKEPIQGIDATRKVLVRSQEFHHSGIINVDICVTDSSNLAFPKNEKPQCFLHGYDFSGLSVKWLSQRNIEIAFDCGRVTTFTNSAFVYPNGPVPVEFHAILLDGCANQSKSENPARRSCAWSSSTGHRHSQSPAERHSCTSATAGRRKLPNAGNVPQASVGPQGCLPHPPQADESTAPIMRFSRRPASIRSETPSRLLSAWFRDA